MATEDEVREAWATTVGQIDGLGAYGWTPGQINTPCTIVSQVGIDFDLTFQRGGDTYTVRAFVLASGDVEAAQRQVSRLIVEIRDRIGADPTLGGVVSDSRVTRKLAESDGLIQMRDGQTYVVSEIETEVFT